MTVKRLILGLMTLLAIARVLLSLGGSLTEPQIQSRLELYQTNLVLYASGLKSDLGSDDQSVDDLIAKSLGTNPSEAAFKQYDKVQTEAVELLDTFEKKLQPEVVDNQIENKQESVAQDAIAKEEPSIKVQNTSTRKSSGLRQQLKQQVGDLTEFIDDIDLKKGILLAEQNQITEAKKTWQNLIVDSKGKHYEDQHAEVASLMSKIWSDNPVLKDTATAKKTIEQNLDSWFRDRALAQFYAVTNNDQELQKFNENQQQLASQAVVKLAFISGIPVVGGFIGFLLLLFLLGQSLFKSENSILATNSNLNWSTPWDWEITWQVIIVGFFFVGQFVLPLLLGLLGLNVAEASLRVKAFYVLFTYALMAIGGLAVLYISLKPYFPLEPEWFKVKLLDKWFIWGFGGYLVAIPCVLLVSLINQQIWHGQGGSNPLLYLALQAQDKVALAIFFITASVAAPVFEELIFRGFLLPSLTRYFSVTTAIILSGFLFAIAHLSLAEVLPLATLGIILGVVYTRSRNILAPMLLHGLWNSGTLLSLFVLGSGSN